jgi:hypothetical protein
LRAGFRYGDAAEMGIIEFVGRDENAKKSVVKKDAPKDAADKKAEKKTSNVKIAKDSGGAIKAAKGTKEVSIKRRAMGK